MIDRKISELTELITPAVNDLLPIVDVSVDGFETKHITLTNLVAGAVGAPSNAEYVTLALHIGLTDERVLVGTANQIVIADGGAGGNVTLSTPQDIAVGSSPTFAGLTINGNITVTGTVDGVDLAGMAAAQFVTMVADPNLANERILTGTANQIVVTDGGAGAAVTLSTPQNIHAGASPTFAGLTLSGLGASRLVATNGANLLVSSDLFAWVAGTANRVTVADDADGTITLSGPQDIHAAATPVFAGLTINGNITVTGTVDGVDVAGANAAQYVTIALNANLANERVLTGTANQITITDGGAGGAVTLSLPQDIDTSADVTFDSLVLDDLTALRLVASDAGEKLVSTDLFAWVAGTANRVTVADDADGTITLSGPQDIAAASSPVFAGLTINGNITVTGTVDGVDIAGIADAQYVVIAADGDLANERILTGTANQIIITDGGAGLAVTLSTPQDIHTGASPTFADVFVPDGGTFGITGNELLTFNVAGNAVFSGCDVGIGAVPGANLEVYESANNLVEQIRLHNPSDGAAAGSYIGFVQGSGGADVAQIISGFDGAAFYLAFETSGTEAIRLVGSKVGINTAGPGGTLEIYESANSIVDQLLLNNISDGAAAGSSISFIQGGGGVDVGKILAGFDGANFYLSFEGGGAEVLRLVGGNFEVLGDIDFQQASIISTAAGDLQLNPAVDIDIAKVTDYTWAMGNSTKDPTIDAPVDWVEVEIAGTVRYLPAYAA